MLQVLSGLEGFFRCAIGCNAYLTPPGSQGFAPHSDDIDAFVLQMEGSKRYVQRFYTNIFQLIQFMFPANGYISCLEF